MATPAEVVESVHSRAWEKAQGLSSSASSAFSTAFEVGSATPSMAPAKVEFDVEVEEPEVTIPKDAEGASVAKMTELSNEVIDKLSGLFRDYLVEYFPNECGYLEKAQAWICETLTNGGTGLAPHVEDQIWQRDRARVLQEVERAGREVLATFASRGFPLPPGAAAHQIAMIQQDAQAKIAQASRDVAIKQAEIEVENVRFAVERAIGLYGTAIGAAGDYIKALSVGPTSAMQIVPSITDSQSRLISAAGDYYRARIAVKELELRSRLPNAEFEQAAKVQNGDWNMQMLKNRLDAAIAAAQSLSTQAAAALNGLHASASVSASASNSVGYSYGGDVSGDVAPKTVA